MLKNLPKIGFRNIKTALAVLIVMLVNVLLRLIDETMALTWYSPFFAGIAAAYSIQMDHSSSFRQARIRSMGSIIGGAFGVVVVLLYESLFQNAITAWGGTNVNLLVFYVFVGVWIVPLIYSTVLLKQTSATFVTVLTFLSVTVSIRNNLPFLPFAINRVASTIFGVCVALLVNHLHFRFKKNRDILFVCGMDGALLNAKSEMSGYTKYQLNNLIEQGAQVTIATTRTPGSLFKILDGVHFRLPLILMNGSVLYDPQTKEYFERKEIPQDVRCQLDAYFQAKGKAKFMYAVIDGVLVVYHTPLINQAEKRFYEDRKNDFFKSHIKGELPAEENPLFYILLDQKDVILAMAKELRKMEFGPAITINVYPFQDVEGYYYLKINSSKTSKEHAVTYFSKQYDFRKIVAFGAKTFDIPMMEAADFSVALDSAEEEVKQCADVVVKSSNPDDLVHEMQRLFNSKKIDEHLYR